MKATNGNGVMTNDGTDTHTHILRPDTCVRVGFSLSQFLCVRVFDCVLSFSQRLWFSSNHLCIESSLSEATDKIAIIHLDYRFENSNRNHFIITYILTKT